MWREKIARAIYHGFSNLEKLDCVEGEEAEAERKHITE
jgi:hypothetical protein